jgi:ketosteroid isomerase-like protein
MSQENVEVARDWYEVLNRWLESYWASPGRPLGETPGTDGVFDRMCQDAEWDWLFSPETFRGREQLLRAAADWIETVDGWQIEVEDVIDGTGDRVVVTVRVVARGRGSGVPVYQRVFSVITVRDGKIALIHDYTDRAKALEAAGLSE